MHNIAESQKNPKWINFNFNPWGKHIGDCAIRATSAATGLDYRVVCKRLKMAYKNGYGLIRDTGVSIQDVKDKFNPYFDVVEDYYENYSFVPDEFKDTLYDKSADEIDKSLGIDAVSNTTLNDFINEFENQGIFIVGLVGNPNAPKDFQYRSRSNGHFVCVKCIHGLKQGFIDIFDCGPMLVDSFMRVKRQEPANSPYHWKYDREQRKFII